MTLDSRPPRVIALATVGIWTVPAFVVTFSLKVMVLLKKVNGLRHAKGRGNTTRVEVESPCLAMKNWVPVSEFFKSVMKASLLVETESPVDESATQSVL